MVRWLGKNSKIMFIRNDMLHVKVLANNAQVQSKRETSKRQLA